MTDSSSPPPSEAPPPKPGDGPSSHDALLGEFKRRMEQATTEEERTDALRQMVLVILERPARD